MRLAAGLALLTAGCVSMPPPGPELRVIRYETMPGFMGGHYFVLTISSNGKGRLERHSRNKSNWKQWITTISPVRVTPAQFEAFEERLRRYRPAGEMTLRAEPDCKEFLDDLPDIKVMWSGGQSPPSMLHYNFGCDMDERREWAVGLDNAPLLLGLKNLPLAGGEWVAYTR